MSEAIYIGRRMRRFDSSPEFDGYSKVIITVSDEIEYSAGTDAGRVMRITCPWGTPEMAANILEDIQGFQYQPYTAESSISDPAAELGDGVTANNIYGGIYSQKIKYGPLVTSTVAAPEDEEINHEYPYKSKPNKAITREAKMLRASLAIEAGRISAEVEDRKNDVENLTGELSIQAKLIEARVTKTGGTPSSFGWSLDDSSWTIKGNGRDILKASKAGLEVYGKITATSGQIGGFAIEADHLSSNNQTWGGTNTTGIYIGPSGIQLGKSFKVDSMGNLTAYSGTFEGMVSAQNIKYGGNSGYFSGAGISAGSISGGSGGKIASSTLSTFNMSGGINTSLGYADWAYGALNGWNIINSIGCYTLAASTYITTPRLLISSWEVYRQSISFVDGNGTTRTIKYWGW